LLTRGRAPLTLALPPFSNIVECTCQGACPYQRSSSARYADVDVDYSVYFNSSLSLARQHSGLRKSSQYGIKWNDAIYSPPMLRGAKGRSQKVMGLPFCCSPRQELPQCTYSHEMSRPARRTYCPIVLPFTVLYPQYPSQPFLSHWETWHRFRADWKSDPESAFFLIFFINVRYEICRNNTCNFIDITASPIMADHRR
jgi:hypothetical protein